MIQQTHASEEVDALARSFEFEKEAERLWLAERTSPTAKSIAGLVLLLSSLSTHDNWKAAELYREDLLDVARKRRLYNSKGGLSEEEISKLPAEERNALAYLAWGTYNYTKRAAQHRLHVGGPPVLSGYMLISLAAWKRSFI